jgi:hypothetical protein
LKGVAPAVLTFAIALCATAFAQNDSPGLCQQRRYVGDTWNYRCQAYSGPAHPRDTVAIIKFNGVTVTEIDGVPSNVCETILLSFFEGGGEQSGCFHPASVELIPGRHSLAFSPIGHYADWVQYLPRISKPFVVNINVLAGKTYKAKYVLMPTEKSGNAAPGKDWKLWTVKIR